MSPLVKNGPLVATVGDVQTIYELFQNTVERQRRSSFFSSIAVIWKRTYTCNVFYSAGSIFGLA